MNNCLECGDELFGRVDKKFCSDQCRNNYNNKQKRSDNNYIRNINNLLRKNHRILASLIKGDKASAKKDKLVSLGFNFNYFTNTYTTKDGRTYYYCYDYGYLPTNEDWYTLVKKKDWI